MTTQLPPSTTISPLAIQQEYWDGRIPIQLSLAPTSVSSPTLPPPVHSLVSRCSYLHVALESAVRRLYPFAPNISITRISIQEPGIGANHNEDDDDDDERLEQDGAGGRSLPATASFPPQPPYPICWFEDEETRLALRWHLFVGVLYEMLHPSVTARLPWKLRLHFTNYPTSQLLPLLDEENLLSAVQFTFKNALKQAITILTGSSKAAMQLTKESHGLIWEAIVTADCGLYHRVDLSSTMQKAGIPIRLLVGRTNPPIQKRVEVASDGTWTVRELLNKWYPDFESSSSSMACTVCGIEQSLSSLDQLTLDVLYKHCYAPDRFLYILLVDRK